MTGVDHYRHSGSKGVNVKICGRVPSYQYKLCRYQVSYLLILRILKGKANAQLGPIHIDTVQVKELNLVNKSGPVSCGLISNYLGYILMYGWSQSISEL